MISKESLRPIVKEQMEILALPSWIDRTIHPDIDKYSGSSALIVKGIRRCGKSTLMRQVMEKKFKEEYWYFNFDDERIGKFGAADFQALMEVFDELFPGRSALFLDEIQNVPEWELFVNRILREGKKVFITGSNATLLSKELGTRMTGRHVDIELFPFSFKEYLAAKKFSIDSHQTYTTKEMSLLEKHFLEYLSIGGMPEAVLTGNGAMLQQIMGDIIQKDILYRYALRKPLELRSVIQFLLGNISNRFTYRAISNNFGIKSYQTIQKYIQYAEETYLLFTVNRFEHKAKLFDKNPKKIYCYDNGIAIRNSTGLVENKGALLENVVAIELKRRGKNIYYHTNRNGTETDFIALNPTNPKERDVIQVCFSVENPLTMLREEKAIIQTLHELNQKKGVILSLHAEEIKRIDGKEIHYVPVWKWLLS